MEKLFPTLMGVDAKSSLTVNKARDAGKGLSALFENICYDLHHVDTSPPSSAELTKEDAFEYFRQMSVIRNMEKTLSALYKEKKIRGFCHLYSGQEAVGVGVHSVMSPEDTAITSYRCHGWIYLLSKSVQGVIAELLAGTTGCARGKGGSMHMYAPRLYGGNGIVGSHIPLGTGVAFAHQYKNDGAVCVTLYGDGAANQGQTAETFNLAKIKSIPVLYLIENNMYAMGTSVLRHCANPLLYTRGDTIPGMRIDGMDIVTVREAARFGLDYVRSGKGPFIVEAVTYRYFGHSMSDPGTSYRSRDEIKQVRDTKDPIMLLKEKILSSELGTEEELKNIDKDAKAEVDKALKASLADKEAPLEELVCDIYSDFKGTVRLPAFGKFIQHKNVGFSKQAVK
ncbi:hypothetical protein NQ315_004410 [Exocentrus adspersus]|uniref:pyruvate dehydrogenase (acetyl-transferring) n=1 Tax=Exocentrus adspersus TaxID=1586481 RepID=A0AAV8W738_9CUCU|nr:hypothetical protein NQ315_004410 [Exocentrus adspersus]